MNTVVFVCLVGVREWALQASWPVVCVDNTNTTRWEMRPYVQLADLYGYVPRLVEPSTPWRFDAEELAKRNSHGVPLGAIQRMLERYEHGVTVDDVRNFITGG